MAKHILFLIHGIGTHRTDWSEELDGPIKTLRQVSRQYTYFQNPAHDPLGDRVEFVNVHYDEVFNEIIAKWRQDSASIVQFDTDGFFKNGLSWLADAKDTDFWWSHLADLAMYRLFPLYRQRVRSHVIAQIANRIEAATDEVESPTCSVLAHSMGTAVAHDCLHLLGIVRWGNGQFANALGPTHWRFQHLFMIANTSRLLQSEDKEMKKAYESIVRPGPVEDPGSYCATYWNVRHEADPVPFPRRFEPEGWKHYTSVVVRHYRELNVHNLSHYLLDPRVHIKIFNKVVSSKAVGKDEEIAAVDAFPQFVPNGNPIDKLKQVAANLVTLTGQLHDDLPVLDWLKKLLAMRTVMEG